MHSAGNDYIYVDITKYPITDPEKTAIEWSKRHTSIGSDGLILIGTSNKANFNMRIFNADGSEAMMCGNGCCCIGKYVYEYGLTTQTEITLNTLSGIKTLQLHIEDEKVNTVTVDMGSPSQTGTVYFGNEYPFTSTEVSMGNSHLVTFVNDITQVNLSEIGPKLEYYSLFPERTNVEFAQIIGKNKIHMRGWERGSGITLASGTGACATVVAAVLRNKAERECEIVMDGGTVTIEWDETTGHVFMTGSAIKIFDGEIEVNDEE